MRQKTSCEAHGGTWSPSARLWREQVTVELPEASYQETKGRARGMDPVEAGGRATSGTQVPPAPGPSGEGRADPPWLAMMVSRL